MKRLISLVMILLISTSFLKAQSLAIGPQVGFIKSSDADKPVVLPGAAVRLKFIGFNIEGAVNYKSEEYENGLIKATSYPIMLTAMINIIPIVHAEAGMGWYSTKIEYSGILSSLKSETINDTGYHVGAGVELPLGNLLLTADLRYIFLNLKLNNNTNFSELKSNYYVVMVGALFQL